VEKVASSDVTRRTPQLDDAMEIEQVSKKCPTLVVTLAGTS
jgi:hypothetical protein